MDKEDITMISAERIFFKVLFDSSKNEFKADPIELHRAFYDLYKENPTKMKSFDFVIKGNPYSSKLEEIIFYYQLCGILKRHNPKLVWYTINRENLEKIKEVDTYSKDIFFLELNKPESIKNIFG